MGGNSSRARNEVNSFLQTAINQSSSISQQCVSNVTQDQLLNFAHHVGNIDIENLDLSQYSNVDLKCMADQHTIQNLDNTLMADLAQDAKSTTASLTASIGNSTEADNIVKLTQQTALNLVNDMNQKCIQEQLQKQQLDFSWGVGNVIVKNLQEKQSTDDRLDCAQKAKNVQDLTNKIEDRINQTATSKLESAMQWLNDLFNSLGMWMILVVVVIIVIIVVIFGGVGKLAGSTAGMLSNGYAWMVIFIIIFIYLVVAGSVTVADQSGADVWPYKIQNRAGNMKDSPEYTKIRNRNILILAIGGAISGILAFVAGKIGKSQHSRPSPPTSSP
jgi:hypothetical protein